MNIFSVHIKVFVSRIDFSQLHYFHILFIDYETLEWMQRLFVRYVVNNISWNINCCASVAEQPKVGGSRWKKNKITVTRTTHILIYLRNIVIVMNFKSKRRGINLLIIFFYSYIFRVNYEERPHSARSCTIVHNIEGLLHLLAAWLTTWK